MAKKSDFTLTIVVVALVLVLGAAGVAVYQLRARAATHPAADAIMATLDPNQFTGKARQAYIIAREHPALLQQLHCFCGCEQQKDSHMKDLYDCYRTAHAAGCEICIGEAILAEQLNKSGMPVEQIEKVLQERYSHGG